MKRLIKLCVSSTVYAWDRTFAAALKLLGRTPPPTCVVLYYHGVAAAQRERFARQMDEALRLAQPVPANLRQPLAGGRHYCAVTFDDGFVSVLENALPETEARKIPVTLFVPTGCLGQPPSWVKRNGSATSRHETVISAAQLHGLKGRKMVAIGAHTITHPRLSSLSEAEAKFELERSKSDLEGILGTNVELFSFPHGAWNQSVARLAQQAGYRRVFTISPVRALTRADEFVTGRVLADPDDWRLEFRLKVMGAFRWMALRKRTTEN